MGISGVENKEISHAWLHHALVTTMYDEAVCAIFPCFLGPNQIVILKIAFLNAGLFIML